MTTLDPKLKDAAELAGRTLGLSPRFIAAWWISENGWEWPSNNNVGNLSYSGAGVPSGGVFEGVTHVQDNNVVVYASEDDGVRAFCHLVEEPRGEHKLLTLDLADLKACDGDIHLMCEKVGASNWAGSHYNKSGRGPGSDIYDVYEGASLAAVFPEENAKTPEHVETANPPHVTRSVSPSHVITIKSGDTLTRLALDHQTTVRALQFLNGIENPNHIEAGEELILPQRYQVKPGDTVTHIAKVYGTTVEKIANMNKINPNFIQVGEHLFV